MFSGQARMQGAYAGNGSESGGEEHWFLAGGAASGAAGNRRAGASAAGRRAAAHLATGLRGEEEALFHLRGLGYTIVARRWTSPRARGDADLIGWDGEWLCFIEVKTRTGRDWVPAGVRGRWSEAGDAAAAGAGVSEGISGGAAAKLSGAVRCGFGVSHDAGGRN
jgi:hypothetical protein